ncbi:MAG: enoyl-CoA hydratase/isomerase family protein [Hyphomicrobiales bacterium]|nr:enoyl-CoA hydratase/isomerase family protein [Hyphomicrobiales bacterium]
MPHNNPDINIRIEQNVGRITLTRAGKFNALTYEMIVAIYDTLLAWQNDNGVAMVMIDAASTKAFCAGGDIQKLYQTGIDGDLEYMRVFWADEYRLNALIAAYTKPYVPIMDGITMGGGVGISAHGSNRLVTSRTMLAMPECAIGLVPDVGGSFLLAKAPGHVGEYMGITGARLNGADAIHAGFADTLIDTNDLEKLKSELILTGNTDCIAKYSRTPDSLNLTCVLEEDAGLIENYFSATSVLSVLKKLQESNSKWASLRAKAILRSSPLALACTWQMLHSARSFGSVDQALVQEYRFVWRSMEKGDILDGTRAMIIDKDHNPNWRFETLEDVSEENVLTMLEPLSEHELDLKPNS